MNNVSLPSPPAPGPVRRIGITGGIGSGKSYVCRQLETAGHAVFYCDDEAKRIIRTDPQVMEELRQLVGNEVYDGEGRLVKSVLAAYLCQGRAWASQVDAIVHPRVAQVYLDRVSSLTRTAAPTTEAAALSPAKLCHRELTIDELCARPVGSCCFMECALLFESGFDALVEESVLIHVSAETQLKRVMARDGITRSQAEKWISLQLPEHEKLQRADRFIVNE